MPRRLSILEIGAGFLAAGCAAGPPSTVDEIQPQAVSIAVGQGRSDFNCPAAAGEVLSRERIFRTQSQSQPQVSGMMVMAPSVNSNRETAEMRSQYTIRVAGCSQRATYTVTCGETGGACEVSGARYRQ
jgi:hypothetical protein